VDSFVCSLASDFVGCLAGGFVVSFTSSFVCCFIGGLGGGFVGSLLQFCMQSCDFHWWFKQVVLQAV